MIGVGESIDFETYLNSSPPVGATKVNLSFFEE
jgi:hypothetical protein